HPDLRHDAEGPLGADDGAGEVVSGVVLAGAAGGDDAAVRQDDLDTENVIDGDAVLEGVRSAAVGGDVAADGAGPLAGWVRRVVVAERLEGVGEPDVHDAGIDDGVAVADVDLVDLAHAGEGDHDAAADGDAAASEARAGAAGEERQVPFVARLHDR